MIPSLVWGEPDTYRFCFDGIPRGSIVAVSTVGMRREKDLFLRGYKEMLKRIEPSSIICYGESFPEMTGKVIHIDYAETNNLTKWYKATGRPAKAIAASITSKGGGSAYGGEWKPAKPADGRLYMGGKIISKNTPEQNRFKSISDFEFCMDCGGEVEFEWKGIRYGAIRYGTDNKITIYEAFKPETEKVCNTADDALEYIVGGDRLRDVITKVTVIDRTI